MKIKITWSLLISAILIFSCGQPDFTDEESRQARLFIEVQKADLQAIQISNSGEPFATTSKKNIQEMLRLRKKALKTANTIPDHVLSKIHKGLPVEFSKYKRALFLLITNLEEGDINAEIEGGALHDEWVDWFNANKHDFKIPK